MKALTFVRKYKKFKGRRITFKRLALFFINRKLAKSANGANFGSITDLQVNRKGRTLTFDASRDGAITTITIRDYRFFTEKNSSYLGWQRIDITGPQRHQILKAFGKTSRISVPKSSIKYLEALL